jgi:hypothetical protein
MTNTGAVVELEQQRRLARGARHDLTIGEELTAHRVRHLDGLEFDGLEFDGLEFMER